MTQPSQPEPGPDFFKLLLGEVDKAINKVRGEQPSAADRFFSTLDMLFSVALPTPPPQGNPTDPDKRPSDSPYDDPRAEPAPTPTPTPSTIHQAKREYTEALKDFNSKSSLPTLRAGVYRHFKGDMYQVIGYAHDADIANLTADRATKRDVVVYFCVSAASSGMYVRSVDDFFAQVCLTTGLSERACDMKQAHDPVFARDHTHALAPRFDYVGPELH